MNQKKIALVITKGKLLEYVICKGGIVIDLEKIESITAITHPNNKNAMQYFLWKINLVHRFVSRFVEIVKPLQSMIKKDAVFKWNNESKEAFQHIKEAIVEVPTLRIPYFDNEFILYTFGYDTSYVAYWANY